MSNFTKKSFYIIINYFKNTLLEMPEFQLNLLYFPILPELHRGVVNPLDKQLSPLLSVYPEHSEPYFESLMYLSE